jgi:nitrogenase iron protein NifH
MISVVFYGKGGVGKSTVASHLSVCFQRRGRRVLLIGCDPKADTSARLTSGAELPTMVDLVGRKGGSGVVHDLIVPTPSGVDVIETGGPEPGLGCGGRGVISLCQLLEEDLLVGLGYDVVVFDVLGDLVCGGFISPLQYSFRQELYIVSSEEVASLFAANNIAKVANQRYLDQVVPAGILFNLRAADADHELLAAFARRINLRILSFVPRDPLVLDAELEERTAIEHAPDSPIARHFFELADRIETQAALPSPDPPTPMDRAEFSRFVKSYRRTTRQA